MQWPYAIPPSRALLKLGIGVAGIITGATLVIKKENPMEDLSADLDKGKAYLIRKYKQIHIERLIRYMEWRSMDLEQSDDSAQSKS
ncbi:hypothetical protein Ddc_08526 [Ditylenchus destructor]|nr:hypothetical protein Ddc_08526 [Ditylenchus destructor]